LAGKPALANCLILDFRIPLIIPPLNKNLCLNVENYLIYGGIKQWKPTKN
jgi:hypothetical protein